MGRLKEFFRSFFHCLGHVYEIILVLNIMLVVLGILFGFIEGIGTIHGVYFSYITALAIGYGDIVPQTIVGKLLSLTLGIIGMLLFGIVVGISTRTVILMMHPDESHNGPKRSKK